MARIRWKVAGFEQLRRSPELEAALQDEVDRVLGAGGAGYAGGVEAGSTRSRGYVVTATPEAIRDNAQRHTLLTLLGGGS